VSFIKNKKFNIRPLKWEDMNDIVDNYYSYFSELKENPQLGLLVGGKKPI
jgi:hypothetical protein